MTRKRGNQRKKIEFREHVRNEEKHARKGSNDRERSSKKKEGKSKKYVQNELLTAKRTEVPREH